MTKSNDIQTLLKTAELPIRNYVSELEMENLKLHKQIARLQVNKVSSDNRIAALEQEIKKQGASAIKELVNSVQGKVHRPKISDE